MTCNVEEFCMQLEGSEAKFEFNIVGKTTKESYMGKFKVKCILSPLEEIEADKTYRDLLGNNYHLADSSIKEKAFALSQLKFRVIEYPPFWDNDYIGGGHIVDSNVILEVIELAIQAQEKYVEFKEKEMKQRQDLLTKAIKNQQIEKDPEVESIQSAKEKLDEDMSEEEDEEEEES
jgi:hypothetical protein